MANLNNRLETLEKSIGVSGQRPVGMTDAQFVRYLSEMPRPEHALFLKAMSDDDLVAVVNFGSTAIADSLPPDVHHKFLTAFESGNLTASIGILKQHLEQEHKHGND